MTNTLALIAAKAALGTSIAVGIALSPHTTAHAYATIQEDDPGWSCVDDGNHMCGPGNSNGVPAGCYDDGGVLVAAWPCHWSTLPGGTRVLYTRDGGSDLYYPSTAYRLGTGPLADFGDDAGYDAGYEN